MVCVGVCFTIASLVFNLGVWKNRPAASACLISGTLLETAGQVLGRLDLWTASWTAAGNQCLVLVVAVVVIFMVWQGWKYGKAIPPMSDKAPKV